MTQPAPYTIELVAYHPEWSAIAAREAERLRRALGPVFVEVHHVGSTAIQLILAKPIVDLVPVVRSLDEVDERRMDVEALGYAWWGDQGIEGRRYCILGEPSMGRRMVQLHIYAAGSDRIAAHLMFRDYLRSHPEEARAYEAEKLRAQVLYPGDVNAYNAVKAPWLRACLERAEAWTSRRCRPA